MAKFARGLIVGLLLVSAAAVGQIAISRWQDLQPYIAAQTDKLNQHTSQIAALASRVTALESGLASLAVLDWQPNTETDLAGYRVYYGRAPGQYLQAPGAGVLVDEPRYVLKNLAAGDWYFAVTAVDASGNESAYSSEVSKLVR